MVPASLRPPFVDPALYAPAGESVFDSGRLQFHALLAKGRPEIALRPARPGDSEALQNYVRALSPESRYNRFLGVVNELPASELARALAANGRDTLTLLLTSTSDERDEIVGEARVALSCAERAGEFSLSIADGWRRRGLGSALHEAIERKAAADGIERLFGDVLRTNDAMIAFALGRGFRLAAGFEPRLARIEKRLEAAPDLPCRKWAEIAGAEIGAA
ncbi:MAG TPA: GNAT family N-acetyltransferase [Roseiarcus sp.]|nr:GNAT family N-acetyltransferase [Roseiarcus sp.]